MNLWMSKGLRALALSNAVSVRQSYLKVAKQHARGSGLSNAQIDSRYFLGFQAKVPK